VLAQVPITEDLHERPAFDARVGAVRHNTP
jgi:hypothetical protein